MRAEEKATVFLGLRSRQGVHKRGGVAEDRHPLRRAARSSHGTLLPCRETPRQSRGDYRASGRGNDAAPPKQAMGGTTGENAASANPTWEASSFPYRAWASAARYSLRGGLNVSKTRVSSSVSTACGTLLFR